MTTLAARSKVGRELTRRVLAQIMMRVNASRHAPLAAVRQGESCSIRGRADADKLGNCTLLELMTHAAGSEDSIVCLGFPCSIAGRWSAHFRRHAPCSPADRSGSSHARGHQDQITVSLEQEGEI
jgi:hypothetical protein